MIIKKILAIFIYITFNIFLLFGNIPKPFLLVLSTVVVYALYDIYMHYYKIREEKKEREELEKRVANAVFPYAHRSKTIDHKNNMEDVNNKMIDLWLIPHTIILILVLVSLIYNLIS